MATAIEALQPELVVIENVRGLLSAPAIRPQDEGTSDADCNPADATPAPATPGSLEPDSWMLGDESARPLRALGAVLGDLADLRYDAEWIGLPASLVGAPHHRFRVFITAHRQASVPNSARIRLLTRWREPGHGDSQARNGGTVSSDHRLRAPRTAWLTDQAERIGDTVHADRGHLREWGGYADAIARWEHITERSAPAPALLTMGSMPRPAPEFVEWFMGLPTGWVTDPEHELTDNQQITALGNGVLPLQAARAIPVLRNASRR